MFEDQLKKQLRAIFGVKKVTFSAPGESEEQECIFIDVDKSMNRVVDKKFIAKVTGEISIFGSSDKMPFGFFSEKIALADSADKEGLAFFDFERNTRTLQNIVQRTVSFVYFFNGQYDPNIGNITSVNIQIEVNE